MISVGEVFSLRLSGLDGLAGKYEAKYIESKKNLLALGFPNDSRPVRFSASWMGRSSNVARTAWKYEICYENNTDTSWYANINMSYPIHQCVCKTHSEDVESIIYKGCISDLTRYFH